MSHFCVVVTGNNVMEQLEPFDEAIRKDFTSHDKEWRESYEKNPHEYETFEEYVHDYCGGSFHEGVAGYWGNKNAKWDWWMIGGRWTGYFKLKEGVTGELGEPGVFGNKPRPGYVDRARVGDIDFDGMIEDQISEAMEGYNKVAEATNGLPFPKTWKQILKETPDIDEARTKYYEQPWIAACRKIGVNPVLEDAVEIYGHSEEVYRQRVAARAIAPFAILYEGKWMEAGQMGWFGVTHNENPSWPEEATKFLRSLPPDTLLTAVDCHI